MKSKRLLSLDRDLSANSQGFLACSEKKEEELLGLEEEYWSSVGGGMYPFPIINGYCPITNNGCDKNGQCCDIGG